MDNIEAIAALAALAQTTRLDTFRLLVQREPEGVPAGELARLMAVPQNTMSAHLEHPFPGGAGEWGASKPLHHLPRQPRASARVMLFLLKDCCGGRPDVCAPLIADLTPCCHKGQRR